MGDTSPVMNDVPSFDGDPLGFVSDEVRLFFQIINFAVICEIIDIFGTGTNIINIICFINQGFKDPVNVSLLGLAISDLGCLVTLIWMNLCFNPLFHQLDLPFESMEIQYLTGGWQHVIFTRVTSWITAFIAFERCLCITLPLKIKTIFTSKRVTIVIVSLFTILIACDVPTVYYVNRLIWKFFPERNRTLLGLGHSDNRKKVERYTFAINNVFIPLCAFSLVIVSTIILVYKLRQKTQWRQKSMASGQSEIMSNRDQRVSKMIVMTSVLFIVCFVPVCIIVFGMTIEPEFSIDGKYKNMFFVVFSFGFIMESTNSAMNIFIYYRMSSKYRAVFRQIFHLAKEKDTL